MEGHTSSRMLVTLLIGLLTVAVSTYGQSSSDDRTQRALTRSAQYVPSPADLSRPDNAGLPAGFGGSEVTAGRRVVVRSRHNYPLVPGLAARIVDGNGLPVPFANAELRVFNVTPLEDPLRSDDDNRGLLDDSSSAVSPIGADAFRGPDGSLSVDWLTGTETSAAADAIANFTAVTVRWCGSAVTEFNVQICPLPATSDVADRSTLNCGEVIRLIVTPDHAVVNLRFHSLDREGSPAAANVSYGPEAIAGALFRPFRIELLTSCHTPLRLTATWFVNDAPASTGANTSMAPTPTPIFTAAATTSVVSSTAPTNSSDEEDGSGDGLTNETTPAPIVTVVAGEVGQVTLFGIGLAGTLSGPVLNDGTIASALFDDVTAVSLPGAGQVSSSRVAPVATVPLNVSFIAHPWVTSPQLTSPLTSSRLLTATVAPATDEQMPVSNHLIRLQGPLRTHVETIIRNYNEGGITIDVGTVTGLAVTTDPRLSPASVATMASETYNIDLNLIRKREAAVFAFVFNASVFASRASLAAVNPLPGTVRSANNTLYCHAEFNVEQAPRGLLFGLERGFDFIREVGRFAIVSEDADTGTQTTQQFAFVFQIGPYRPLSSALRETLTCYLSPGLLALNYVPQPQRLQLTVDGLPDKGIGTARRVLSILALLNPEIAYISVAIQVCDCTIDNGLPMDMALHPLQFAVGENQLTQYYIGALAGNGAIMVVCFFASLFAARRYQKKAKNIFLADAHVSEEARVAGVTNPKHRAERERAQQREIAEREQDRLNRRAALVFPRLPMLVATALYPGTTYAAFGLLPHITNTVVLIAWCFVGIAYTVILPLTLVRIAIKLSPDFKSLDVHSLTSSWLWKIIIPLGEYESTHSDMTRYRFAFASFRGNFRWFYGPLMASWLVLSIFGARFVVCYVRFIVPFVTHIVFFFFVVARAPYITAYGNVVAVMNSLMIVIASAFLFWDGMERRSTTILTSWSITLSLLTMAMVGLRMFYVYWNKYHTMGAQPGKLSEEFLLVEEGVDTIDRGIDQIDRGRKNLTNQVMSHLPLRRDTDGADNSEFVDATHEAAAEDDNLRVTVVDMREDRKRADTFGGFDDDDDGRGPRGEARTLDQILDDILANARPRAHAAERARFGDNVSQREFETRTMMAAGGAHRSSVCTADAAGLQPSAFDDWRETMSKRERREAERTATLQMRTGRSDLSALHDRVRDQLTPAERERLDNEELERQIYELMRRRSKPTANPTYKYGQRFAPDKTFAYQRRLEQLTAREEERARAAEETPDLIDVDPAEFLGLDADQMKGVKRRVATQMRKPQMPQRRLGPGLLQLSQRRAAERDERRRSAEREVEDEHERQRERRRMLLERDGDMSFL